MSKIISSSEASKYNIQKFEFGVSTSKVKKRASVKDIFSKKEVVEHQASELEKKSNKEYEELLKRVDELSSEVVYLQMKLENQEKEFEQKLQEEKEKSFHDGVEDATKSMQQEIEELKVQYISSITSLQELEIEIKEKLSTFEEELIETSIIIASKVIKKEVEENSSSIAKSIAKYLLSDIKDEVEVKLLVSPVDYDELLKENLKSDIKIVSDNSIKAGGVILLSKDNNIDGTIETRFKKTLQLIKES